MADDLLAAEQAWHDEASRLLTESQLASILAPLGEVQYTGSYDYRVLMGADIDIYVITSNADAKTRARAALDKLIDQNYWNGYLFYDFAAHPSMYHLGFPNAYYVGVKGDYAGHRWKVDIWFGESETLNHDNAWIKAGMTDANRKIILTLKQARNEGKMRAESHEIYRAVLRHGVEDIKQFLNWQRDGH